MQKIIGGYKNQFTDKQTNQVITYARIFFIEDTGKPLKNTDFGFGQIKEAKIALDAYDTLMKKWAIRKELTCTLLYDAYGKVASFITQI